MMEKDKVIIVGAGLSGLLLGSKLKEHGIPFRILEAKKKEGGRVLTIEETNDSPPMEMGPMWFLKGIHVKTERLLEKLNMNVYPQYLKGKTIVESATHFPTRTFDLVADNAESYRIENGNHALIKKLVGLVGKENIVFDTVIQKITRDSAGYTVMDQNHRSFQSDIVVTTVPPNLLVNTIEFSPALPEDLVHVASHSMTWKAQATKFSISYATPFWREKGLSGLAYSNKGPIVEVYDHSSYADSKFSLMGFVVGLDQKSEEDRKAKIIDHLTDFFGAQIKDYISYHEKLWAEDPYVNYNGVRLPYPEKQNIGRPEYVQNLGDHTLIIGGTETSQGEWAGYLEGAVDSTDRVLSSILKTLKFTPISEVNN